MRRIKALAATAALALPMAVLAAHSPADATTTTTSKAAYHRPQVALVVHARASGGKASVRAVYRCWGGNEGTHLWVSLKQGGGIRGKSAHQLSKMEGTSKIARAWYDTNVVNPRKVTINCNGRWHVHRYTVKREKGTLRDGRAFLQFCLFDSHSDPTGKDLSKGFAYKYKLLHVHR
jgi:hypothetical protein